MELLLQLCDAAKGGSPLEQLVGGEAAECGEAACMIEFAGEAGEAGEAGGEGASKPPQAVLKKRGRPASKKKQAGKQHSKKGDKNAARSVAGVLTGSLGNLQLAVLVASPPSCAPSPPSASCLLELNDENEDQSEQPATKRVCSATELAMQAAVGRKAQRFAIAHVYVHGSEKLQLDCCEPECFWTCERASEGDGNRGGWMRGTLHKIALHLEMQPHHGMLASIRTVEEHHEGHL